ncbi:hypothetical protein C8Q77DRAFT_1055720 [Trametes polyzona]|nr:hypothetical protein C8Q77DRAFT_1055720 [Trametes polyzona]
MPGILLVFSEPGSAVTDEEFNNWYDNEHVPLRLPIPGFQSWSRWTAVDGERPTYAAIYDLTSPSVIDEPPYSELAHTRSERESSIISRLALLDRRTYTLREPVVPAKAGAAYDMRAPGPFLSIAEFEVKPGHEAEFDEWYQVEHGPLLAQVPGWVRSRRFVLEFAAATGTEAKEERPPTHLTLNEWQSPDAFETAEFKDAAQTPGLARIRETAVVEGRRRLFKFARSWDRV